MTTSVTFEKSEQQYEQNIAEPIKKVDTISGYRDYTEGEATLITYWRERLKGVYEKYGCSPVENRPVERKEHLLLKGGLNKEIYGLCRAQDGTQVSVGLPFDRTVPLALWVAQQKNDIAFPFKRYDVDYSFRGESAVAHANRYRGFIQADVDIIDYNMGSRIQADAESLAITIRALESLNIPPFVMNVNHIRIARAIIKSFGVADEKVPDILQIIDKLEKKSHMEIVELIREETQLETTQIEQLIKKFEFRGDIQSVDTEGYDSEALNALDELKKLFEALENLGVKKEQVVFNLGMVRGLDYYTGVVCETFFEGDLKKYGSIASGGRYDKLVDLFVGSETGLQGVGVSIGLTRLFSILRTEDQLDVSRRGNADILVGFRTEAQMIKAINIANQLREEGYNVDLYSGDKKIKGQLTYASKKKIPFMLMVMNESDSFVVKDMQNPEDKKGQDFETVKGALDYFKEKSKK